MASFVQVVEEALSAYWLSPFSLSVLAVCGACMGMLTGLYALSIFFWAFLAGSLVLCVSQARMVAYARNGVPLAVFGAVVGGLAASGIISAVVWKYGNASVLRRFAPRSPAESESWVQDYARLLAKFEGVGEIPVGIVDSVATIAMAVGGKHRTILVSTGLLTLLDRDEVEAVVSHELMHLKHHDSEFKVFSRVLARILFFDPFSKFFDPAVHREREYLADEVGARSSGKPATLASALLKIASRGPQEKASWGLSILGSGKGLFSRPGKRLNTILIVILAGKGGRKPYVGYRVSSKSDLRNS
jgi:Zn-dependent protease with chaperone function